MLDNVIKEDEVELELIIPVPSYTDENEIALNWRPKLSNDEFKRTATSFTFVSKTDIDLEQLSRFLTDPTLAKLLEHPGQ